MDRAAIPSVDLLLRKISPLYPGVARDRLLSIARDVLQHVRELELPFEEIESEIARRVARLTQPTLRRVINATGVVLHTNLGRAPLRAFEPVAGYSNLEYDLATGKRGKRDEHFAPLLAELLGVAAIAVNNNAAATYLVLRALAEGGEVVVSRSELVEIGDGFRIPDIMEQSGAKLKEVGATNKTNLDDYSRAIGPNTRMLMRVHPSNFHQTGFVGKPTLKQLAGLAKESNLPLYEDLGSGCLMDLRPYGVDEPLVADSRAAGVNLVSFSCDKLLGGPQAGIIAGDGELIAKIRRHPMYRALRLDKLAVQALSDSLRSLTAGDFASLPGLRMLMLPIDAIRERAEALAGAIEGAKVVAGQSVLGGGSTPDQSIPTWLVALPHAARGLEKHLRASNPPVVARIEKDQLLIDLRTVFAEDDAVIVSSVNAYARSM
ncbi:MAG: L-seryl-tRNA(Sec) selenium transferase [Acidobacteria bacterium]|nr:L-seryl-tRNA(Sec) selenium transferase [Acidobacteriota bacterium]